MYFYYSYLFGIVFGKSTLGITRLIYPPRTTYQPMTLPGYRPINISATLARALCFVGGPASLKITDNPINGIRRGMHHTLVARATGTAQPCQGNRLDLERKYSSNMAE